MLPLFSDAQITLTKLDAARRQLKTAIELWFADGDAVSIHTLAYAAFEVIDFVGRKRKRPTDLIFDSRIVRADRRKEWRAIVSKEAWFFKHADRDPEAVIEFKPDQSKFFMMFAIVGLAAINEALTPTENAFYLWVCVNHPDTLKEEGREIFGDPLKVQNLEGIKKLGKSEFLEAVLRAFNPSATRPRGITLTHIQLPEF